MCGGGGEGWGGSGKEHKLIAVVWRVSPTCFFTGIRVLLSKYSDNTNIKSFVSLTDL